MCIVVTKIYYPENISEFLTGFSIFESEKGVFVSTISPILDAVKPNSPLSLSMRKDSNALFFVNLLFDHSICNNQKTRSFIAGNQKIAFFGKEDIQSSEAFANFIFEIGIPNFSTPSNFWVPFESALTHRQLEILFHVYHGQASKRISEMLNISPRTVELHRQNCILKIGALSPEKLAAFFSSTPIKAFNINLPKKSGA